MIEEEIKRLIRVVLIEEGLLKVLPYTPPEKRLPKKKSKWQPSDGETCPECKSRMMRRCHDPSWEPKASAAYYFKSWLYCRKCQHVQFQEKDKVYL